MFTAVVRKLFNTCMLLARVLLNKGLKCGLRIRLVNCKNICVEKR